MKMINHLQTVMSYCSMRWHATSRKDICYKGTCCWTIAMKTLFCDKHCLTLVAANVTIIDSRVFLQGGGGWLCTLQKFAYGFIAMWRSFIS